VQVGGGSVENLKRSVGRVVCEESREERTNWLPFALNLL